jgi:hypothetical protein
MKVQTIQLDGREYVVIPREEFENLSARPMRKPSGKSGTAGDVAEAARRRAAGPTRSYASLRKKLGLKR